MEHAHIRSQQQPIPNQQSRRMQQRQPDSYLSSPPTSSSLPSTSNRSALRTRQENVGESFLAMDPESSSSPSSTKVASAGSSTMLSYSTSPNRSVARSMQNRSAGQAARGMNYDDSDVAEGSSQRAQMIDLYNATLSGQESEQSGNEYAARPKAKSRGTRLGMQMGKMKVASPSHPPESLIGASNREQGETFALQHQQQQQQQQQIAAQHDRRIPPTQQQPQPPTESDRSNLPREGRSSASSARQKGMEKDSSTSSFSSSRATYDSTRLTESTSTTKEAWSTPHETPLRRTSSPDRQNTTRSGQLSDATIAELGATPGMEPAALLNSDGQALSSKNILTIALQKAQSAVLLDGSNNVAEAILAYKQAVRLLQEVMERVSPKSTSNSKSSRKVHREEERRRLKVIHDTYAERIRLLSMIYSPNTDDENEGVFNTFNAGEPADTSGEADNEEEPEDETVDRQSWSEKREAKGKRISDHNAELSEQIATPTTAAPIINVSHDEPHVRATPHDRMLLDPDVDNRGHNRIEDGMITPSTPYFDANATFNEFRHSEDLSRSNATTLVVSKATAEPKRIMRDQTLVSPSTSQGTISQRRRNTNTSLSAVLPPSPTLLTSGNESQSVTPTLASVASMISTGTTPPPPMPGSDGVLPVMKQLYTNHMDDASSADKTAVDLSEKLQMSDGEAEARERQAAFSSAVRKRATSQPSHRRPTIPAAFLPGSMRSHQTATPPPASRPPMPKITRKASMPLTLLPQASGALTGGSATITSPSGAKGGLGGANPLPSPAPSSYSGYHMLGTPISAVPPTSNLVDDRSLILQDLFPTALPSMQMGMQPSFASNSASLGLAWMGVSNSIPDSNDLNMPNEKCLRPFHTMKQLSKSIEKGSYLTQKLFLPKELWLQNVGGSRLSAVDTKIRMVDLMSTSMDNVENYGQFLLHEMSFNQPGTTAIHVAKFVKSLDEMESVMMEVQHTLNKKLGNLEGSNGPSSSSTSGPGSGMGGGNAGGASGSSVMSNSTSGGTIGKRSNLNTFNALSSKLSKSINHMVAHNSKSTTDSPAVYIEGLSRLFNKSQILGDHLSALLESRQHNHPGESSQDVTITTNASGGGGAANGAYATGMPMGLPPMEIGYSGLQEDMQTMIEFRLRKMSEFFANVVLRFVLHDLTILVDKSVKRNAVQMFES
ncbi:uncharacterized protein FA14DRAFT_74564 [Meira miltonrushii]|uniref:MIT domain-containing protein n=1 Tax=Meira miltonrushii TaxID=1280837 RepID=A0A316V8F0_9BASI|nr:uncharacterized protein FA14DRAFT_74564 [Meira miltonrushii]PWN32473.1 hypothetical protein FA14DRAFT_74564 [Meira miltonrushii]